MSLKDTVSEKLKSAMKEGNEDQKRVLRLIMAASKLAEVENRGSLDDAAYLGIIQKEVKIRREALEGAVAAQREDLIAISKREISILEELLPTQLSDEELLLMANKIIDEIGASSLSDTGKVMKILMPKVQGRAPGDKVSLIARQALQNRS
ncbi:MAG: GatB/YqeY domain-containing protein [Bellilinea sp.]